jgi:hypothetical protein
VVREASGEWRRISHKINLTNIVPVPPVRSTVIIKSNGPLRINFRLDKDTTSLFIILGQMRTTLDSSITFRIEQS